MIDEKDISNKFYEIYNKQISIYEFENWIYENEYKDFRQNADKIEINNLEKIFESADVD